MAQIESLDADADRLDYVLRPSRSWVGSDLGINESMLSRILDALSRPQSVVLNFYGKVTHVDARGHTTEITNHIESLRADGHVDLASAFDGLVQAALGDVDLQQDRRAELLTRLDRLVQQASRPRHERSRRAVKRVWQAVATVMPVAGATAQVWAAVGPVIQKFLGLAG